MIRRPPRSTRKESSAASDVYKRQTETGARARHLSGLPRPTPSDLISAVWADDETGEILCSMREPEIDPETAGAPALAPPVPAQRSLFNQARPVPTRRCSRMQDGSYGSQAAQAFRTAAATSSLLHQNNNKPVALPRNKKDFSDKDSSSRPCTVSYTHLTLPTTPYV